MAHAHAGMDHGHMDHGHGDMDMGGKCSMNVSRSSSLYLNSHIRFSHDCAKIPLQMLFTWSTKDLCIVFRGWRITGTWSLILSLLAIVLLTAGYEAVREASRRYDLHAKSMIEGRRGGDDLTSEYTISFPSVQSRRGVM